MKDAQQPHRFSPPVRSGDAAERAHSTAACCSSAQQADEHPEQAQCGLGAAALMASMTTSCAKADAAVATAGNYGDDDLLALLPHHLLTHQILPLLSPGDTKAVRLLCSGTRAVTNQAVRTVQLDTRHLAHAGARLGSAFPCLSSIRIQDDAGQDQGVQDAHTTVFLQGCAAAWPQVCRQVTRLDLKRANYVTSQTMEEVARTFSSLTHVAPSRWANAASINALCSSRLAASLTHLDLGDADIDVVRIDDAALVPLASLQALTSLSLSRCRRITDAVFPTLAQLPSLQQLCMSHTGIAGRSLCLLAHGRLAELDVSGCVALNDEALQQLAPLATLSVLSLGNTAITEQGLAHLVALPRLAVLDLGMMEVRWQGAQALGACHAMADLTLGNFNLRHALTPPAGMPQAQRSFPALATLRISGLFWNRGLEHVFPLPALCTLHMRGFNALSDHQLMRAAAQSSLTALHLSGGYQLSHRCALDVVSRLPALNVLSVRACPHVQSAELTALARSRGILLDMHSSMLGASAYKGAAGGKLISSSLM